MCPQHPPEESLGTSLPPREASEGRRFILLLQLEQDPPRKLVLFEKYLYEKRPLSFASPIPTIELDIFPANSPALGSPSPNPLKSPIELESNKSLKGHVVLWLSATDLGEVPKAEQLGPLASASPTATKAYGHSTSDFSPKY